MKIQLPTGGTLVAPTDPTHDPPSECSQVFALLPLVVSYMASMQGVIKRLISDKGFGFVQASDGNEYFFHQSAVVDGRFDELREGQSLTFDTGQGPKGPRAENIRRA